MKYELQFTVKTDAVKQNRKLPEIAFFDTDGNPISLGGGGSVDVSGLLPRDGSRAMTGPLDLGGPSLVFDDSSWYGSDYPVLGILGLEDSELDILESSVVAVSADGNHYSGFAKYGFFTDTESADAISFGIQVGGGWHRFRIHGDGTFDWGPGGAIEPDVSLKRNQWGGLLLTSPDGLAVAAVDPDPAYNTAAIYLDHAGKLTVQPAQPDNTAFLIGPAAVGDGVYRFQMDGHGQMWWSDGVAAEDTSLKRSHPGQLEMGDATGVGSQFSFGVGAGGTSPSLYMQVDGDGDDYIFLAPWQDQSILIGRHGGGIRLTSPDGSQHKTLRLSNAGELELVL